MENRRKTALLLSFLASPLLLPTGVLARDTTPPASFDAAVAAIESVPEVVMPPVDARAYLAEDEARMEKEGEAPFRFAAPLATSLTTENAGSWETLADGGRVWRLRVRSEGALSLNFGFTTFDVPDGAMLHVYDANRGHLAGPFRREQSVEGEFWTPIVPGDRAVIELFVPAGATTEPRLVLAQVGHDYRGFGEIAARKLMQGSCNNDVICPVGDPWRDDIRSGAVYTLSGAWTCSGQMLNSNVDEPAPIFHTAYHCGITTSNDQTIVVYWNYESPTCGVLCCGSLADHQTGSLLLSRSSASDFCLVQLSAEPDTSWHVYYAGWDATGNAVGSSVCIHHPNCEEKMISFNTDPLTVTSYLSNTVPGNGSHWRVDDWEDGTTEGGSSGSGLWDPNHRVVGQLHGGYASCTSITSDWYGRLSVSWNGGGTSATRMKDWLDPLSTGVLTLDGRDPWAIDTRVEDGRPAVDRRSSLFPISPNPTRGNAEIFFELPRPGVVEMEVYSASGRMVSSIPARSYPAGSGSVLWDGAAKSGLPAGVYFVRMRVDGAPAGTEKVVFLR
jgi:hypothetical protein